LHEPESGAQLLVCKQVIGEATVVDSWQFRFWILSPGAMLEMLMRWAKI
jgi:hypothetical protein